ncbi:thiopeptide-type bacteriocin biosynthesis protein [Lacticaseibacillus zhaodongensis]|uniref:thiopeptide-type bacteriocin biosynthesis protein n=1 Tax=Lacticaseibacillus zhaodongensis TaxID=2668065 RepID=UPI0012D35904|nr:thiopeptide-type bacteriocin biosynthesis protein [Lacticaseibacillus zhaodongensis]
MNDKLDIIEGTSYGRAAGISFCEYRELSEMLESATEFKAFGTTKTGRKFMGKLASSNPNLYIALLNDNHISDKMRLAIKKYLLRMCTRATPFGELASVFDEGSVDKTQYDIDGDWYTKVLERINLAEAIADDVILLYRNGNFVYYAPDIAVDFGEEGQTSIRLVSTDSLLKMMGKSLEKPLNFTETKIKFNDTLDGSLTDGQMISLLLHLIDIDLLCWQLNSKKTRLYEKLTEVARYLPVSDAGRVGVVVTKLRKVNSLGACSSFDIVNIVDNMNQIEKVRNPLMTISAVKSPLKNVEVTNARESVNKAASDLNRLTPYVGMNFVQQRVSMEVFNKFGANACVPLSEVMSIIQEEGFEQDSTNKLKDILKEVLLSISLEGRTNEVLDLKAIRFVNRTLELIEKKKMFGTRVPFQNRFELLLTGVSGRNDSWSISPSIGVDGNGRYGGRFFDVFSGTKQQDFKRAVANDGDQEIEIVDLVSDFSSHSAVNVIPKNSYRGRAISLNEVSTFEDTLRPDSLKVHVDSKTDYPYLSDGKNVISVQTVSMIYPPLGGKLYSTIDYISRVPTLVEVLNFIKEAVLDLDRAIEVSYGGFTIFPPMIRAIRFKDMASNVDGTQLYTQLEQAGVVNGGMVTVSRYDDAMVVDVRTEFGWNIVVKEMKNIEGLVFVRPSNAYVESLNRRDNTHAVELLCSFDSSRRMYEQDLTPVRAWKNDNNLNIFNSLVVYYQIDVPKFLEDHFLQSHLQSWRQSLGEEYTGHIQLVRYAELSNELRLRIFTKHRVGAATIKQWTRELESLPHVNAVRLCEYQREVCRYGGINSLRLYEELSCVETGLIMDIMSIKVSPNVMDGTVSWMLFQIWKLLGGRHSLSEESERITRDKKKIWESQFRVQSKKMEEIYNDIMCNRSKVQLQISRWIGALYRYVASLGDKNYEEKYEICRSLGHMLCNRAYGVEHDKEMQAYLRSQKLLNWFTHIN